LKTSSDGKIASAPLEQLYFTIYLKAITGRFLNQENPCMTRIKIVN